MPLQTSIHSLQIYTPGPAISFLTSEWLLPQNEHIVRFEFFAIVLLSCIEIVSAAWGKPRGCSPQPVFEDYVTYYEISQGSTKTLNLLSK